MTTEDKRVIIGEGNSVIAKEYFRAPTKGNPGGAPLLPALAKVWLHYDQVADSILDSFNVSGVADDAAGIFTPSWDTDFAGPNYALGNLSSAAHVNLNAAPLAGSAQLRTRNISGTNADQADNMIIGFGDQ